MANTNDTARLRSLYAAALFWDAIEVAASAECLDGELPEAIWDEAEENEIRARDALVDAIKGRPRINETRAVRLVYGASTFYHLEEYVPELEGIATTGVWAEITGRSA